MGSSLIVFDGPGDGSHESTALPATDMLQGTIVPGLKSFLELVSDLEEQLSMAIGTESESYAWAWSIEDADRHVMAMSLRLHAMLLFLSLPCFLSLDGE